VTPAPLPVAFYDRAVLDVARDLIGCTFLFRGVGGRIVETEAYGPDDPACHAYRGQTARNAVMFGPPGRLYVYFTYGMHFCANLVCEGEGVAAAVLVRALEPQCGIEEMVTRRGVADRHLLCGGPARLCQALGIGRDENGIGACAPPLVVLPQAAGDAGGTADRRHGAPDIVTTKRIGISPADGRMWRFVDAGSTFLSRPLPRRRVSGRGRAGKR